MHLVLLIIHFMLCAGLIGLILMQRSEGGALGVGGGGPGGLMSGRGAANLLTRTTSVLAVGFFITSILLTVVVAREGDGGSVLDRVGTPSTNSPAISLPDLGDEPAEIEPAAPAEPVIPDEE